MKLYLIKVNLLIAMVVFLSVKSYSQAKVGDKAPVFTVENVHKYNADSISLEMLRGNIVILDFWATWCKHCV